MKERTVESSINKLLAELQLAGTAVNSEVCEDCEDTFETMLREALKSENEAIEIYGKLVEKAKNLGSNVLIKAFAELKEDEQKHIGNLNYLLELLCEDAVNVEKEGEAEEAKLQAEKNNSKTTLSKNF